MKRIFAFSILLSFIGVTNLFSQQIIPVQRPADYEYLSAPDSLGSRHPLEMPSLSRTNGQILPYPIIFIHGLNSGFYTWDTITLFMRTKYGFSYGGRIDYCLNYDRNNYSANINSPPATGADLARFTPMTLVAGDYYYVNFDIGWNGIFCYDDLFSVCPYNVESNQQAIVKQGIALSDAIYRVLQITGRDKVILVGHSMGGLAAREYLQNQSIWQADGQHHVAKLVTTGTPHGGSNEFGLIAISGLIPDGQSEAVRDLRTFYSISNNRGVYLFGGIENLSYMEDQVLHYFYNSDVNCNGVGGTGESITGLNYKTIPANIDYSCIIGRCTGIGCGGSFLNGDGLVTAYSANLNNYPPSNYLNHTINLFYFDEFALIEIHTDLPQQYYENMQGLDEPNEYDLSYGIEFNTLYAGFITVQPVGGYPYDYDDYKFFVPAIAM